jgi:hypothetical protein
MPIDCLLGAWKQGYKPDVNDSVTLASCFDEIFRMNRWAKNGEEFHGVECLFSTNGQQELVVHGSKMDFGCIPAKYHGSNALVLFLELRGVGALGSW